MKKKIILLSSIVVVCALTLGYFGYDKLIAKDGSCPFGMCSDKKEIKTETLSQPKAGGDNGTYEFTTDKACCESMKNTLRSDLLTIGGVKEITFGETCSESKMTNVKVSFSSETSSEKIASFLKDKNLDCSGKECEGKGCDKESKTGGCPKNKKSADKKNI